MSQGSPQVGIVVVCLRAPPPAKPKGSLEVSLRPSKLQETLRLRWGLPKGRPIENIFGFVLVCPGNSRPNAGGGGFTSFRWGLFVQEPPPAIQRGDLQVGKSRCGLLRELASEAPGKP